MKALLLTNKPFLPVIDGGTAASESFANQLIQEGFDLTYLTFNSEKHSFKPNLFLTEPWKNLNAQNILLHLKPNFYGAIKSIIGNKSYQLSRFESQEMLHKLSEQIDTHNFEYIIFDSLYAAQMIEEIKLLSPNSKFILRAHNVETLLAVQKIDLEKNWLKKKYLKILSTQLLKREKEIVKETDLVLAISENDALEFKSWNLSAITTLPYFPLYNTSHWIDRPNTLMHFGAMNWQPNVLAYKKLTSQIFPEIVKVCPQAKLVVAGSFMDSIETKDSSNIEHLGFVKDKFEFLANNGILLAPIANGSGVRIKLIEALSIGVPIITTKEGAMGIPVKDNYGLLVCESEEDFIEKSIELLLDKSKRKKLSDEAKDFYQKWHSNFSLVKIFQENV